MYNITHGRRPTHQRSQVDAGGRAPGRSSDARPRGACEARRGSLVGGASKVSGRMGLLAVLTFHARGEAAATHERGARDLQPGVRSIRLQASAPHAAPAMNQHQMVSPTRNRSNTALPSLLGLTFRRLPSVASGKPQDGDGSVFNRAGYTLAEARFGLEKGVHPRGAILRRSGKLTHLCSAETTLSRSG